MSLARADSVAMPLASSSVDLIVTSPPYFALRSYTDGGEHYGGQIGSEPTPAEFLAALWAVTAECVRVLKPSGSLWVNLGDKYAGSGGGNQSGILAHRNPALDAVHDQRQSVNGMDSPRRYNQDSGGVRAKSLMGLPWRYALGCIDDLGLILRAEVIWAKPNGLPESVTDRVRRSHEQWFMFTKEPRYFSAVDEVREPHAPWTLKAYAYEQANDYNRRTNPDRVDGGNAKDYAIANPLGKLPGSVWQIPTEPLRVPDHLPQHFAAFPSEWPRRIILGWSPSGICVECGEGRRPTTERSIDESKPPARRNTNVPNVTKSGQGTNGSGSDLWGQWTKTEITGYSCACPTPDAPTRPAVVLDPFAGTGTTVAVARALGRTGIGLDLSADYLKVARWRCNDPGLRAKVLRVDKPKAEIEGQLDLLEAMG